MKIRLATLTIAITLLGGCAIYNDRTAPMDVTAIPNDCANKRAILNWLTAQARQPKGLLTHEHLYDQQQSAIKQKIWEMRYYCNPLR